MGAYNKSLVAVVGVLVTFATTYLPTGYDHWLQLVVGLLTAAGVYSVANTPGIAVPPPQG